MDPTNLKRLVRVALALTAAGLAIVALFSTGALYGGFPLSQTGVYVVPKMELAFYAWYAFWGTLGTASLAAALSWLGVSAKLPAAAQRIATNPLPFVVMGGALVMFVAVAVRFGVLLDEPITDDELAYTFEAQTLLEGRLVNPVPTGAPFFRNQFIILNEHGWAGKYPLGHPLLLALGEAVGSRWLVVPLLGLGSMLLTYFLGRRLFGDGRAALGACMLVASPHFVLTHATQISQPSSAFFLLLSAWALLRLLDSRGLGWAVLAGLACGFSVAIRPMPSALFLAVMAGAAFAHWQRESLGWPARFRSVAAALPGVALGAALILLYNRALTGNPFSSGYEAAHGVHGSFLSTDGQIPNSLGGAIIRENFWLFGWTASLLFVPFARPRRYALVFWGLVAAEYAYRVLVPKTVVATTGPVYVFEVVPLLALATADGAVRAADWLAEKLAVEDARAKVMGAMLSAAFVALVAFVPIQLRTMAAAGDERARLPNALAALKADHAIVFTNYVADPVHETTWAYFPPNPSPDFSDAVIYARLPENTGGVRMAHRFWQQQFSDRRAFVFVDGESGAALRELTAPAPPDSTHSLSDFLRATAQGPAEAPAATAPEGP